MDMSVFHKGRENSIANPMNSSTNDFQFTTSFASSNILTKPSALYYSIKQIPDIISFHLKYLSISKRTLLKI